MIANAEGVVVKDDGVEDLHAMIMWYVPLIPSDTGKADFDRPGFQADHMHVDA